MTDLTTSENMTNIHCTRNHWKHKKIKKISCKNIENAR